MRYPGAWDATALTFTDADDNEWSPATTSTGCEKLYTAALVDTSGLEDPRVPNVSVRQRLRGRAGGHRTVQRGSFQLSLWLNCTSSTVGVVKLLNKVYGALVTPGTVTDALDSSGTHTVQRLYASGIESIAAIGTAIKVGVKGDTRGDGQVRIVTATGTDYVDLSQDLPAAPADADVITYSHTIYPVESAATETLEFLILGEDENDQFNCIGCGVTAVEIASLNVGDGELPIITFTIEPGRFRNEPDGSKATLNTTTAATGADPISDEGIALFTLADHGASFLGETYTQFCGGKIDVKPNLVHARIPCPTGVNGVGGWRRVAGEAMFSFDALFGEGTEDPMETLTADFTANTAKQMLYQVGASDDNCVAIDLQRTYLDKRPTSVDADPFKAVHLEGHADEGATTTNDLTRADHRLHFFPSS